MNTKGIQVLILVESLETPLPDCEVCLFWLESLIRRAKNWQTTDGRTPIDQLQWFAWTALAPH